MKVPMLDLGAQQESIGAELKRAVCGVIDSTRYIMGPEVKDLEREIAKRLGVAHAIGVSSGTDALLVALMALGVGPGDVVVTTAYSFFATAGAPARLGADLAFVDIDPRTYNIDVEALASWFDEQAELASRVKVIIPVHLYGQCAEMGRIREIAKSREVAVLEDAAQAILATYPTGAEAIPAGRLGDLGAFSFFPSKNLGALGDGGMVTTNDDELAAAVRRLRVHGAEPKYYHAVVGGNFRLDAIQAAALRVKLPHLATWNEGRRRRAAYYDERFAELDAVQPPICAHGREHHVYNQYVIRVAGDRDGLRGHLADRGVSTSIFYPVPFHLQECFAGLGYQRGALPESELAAEQTLAIPTYPEMTKEMQDHVVDTIRDFYA